jgi:TonB family protein
MNIPTKESPIDDLLHEVQTRADSRDYDGALDLLEIVRSSDPGNIYISALKRQIEEIAALERSNDLNEERRQELFEPMPGIIECALRDGRRSTRPGPPPPPPVTMLPETKSTLAVPPVAMPPVAMPPVAMPPVAMPHESQRHAAPGARPEDEARKELEALKLLYFQRASKFVMKGEYEQALAEVKRVFVVDPENTIAKQYSDRVENLLEHARRLAAEPIDPAPEAPTVSVSEPDGQGGPGEEDRPSPVRSRHSTAWTDDFESPKTSTKPSERSIPHASRREAHAYGDRLALAIGAASHSATEPEEEKPSRSRKAIVLVFAIAILVLGGGTFVVLSSMNSAAGEDLAAIPPRDPGLNTQAAGSFVTGQSSATGLKPQQTVVSQAKEPVSPPPETKVAQKSDPLRSEPPAATPGPKAITIAPSKQELAALTSVAGPAPAETKPAVVEEPPAPSPAFVPVEKEPKVIKLERPQFPDFVWTTVREGSVIAKVLIDTDGKPIDTQVLKSTSSVFEEPVMQAIMKSQFAPAEMGQGPVTAWLTITFKFKQPR